MQHILNRVSPAFVVAVLALFVALAGTAAAATLIITDPGQVKEGVIDQRHIRNESLSDIDFKDPQLRLRVAADGTKIGSGEASVRRTPGFAKGSYEVTFDAFLLNGGNADTGTDTVLNENCAINATPHDALRQLLVKGPTVQRPNTVTVETAGLRNITGGTQFQLEDNAFDIVASC